MVHGTVWQQLTTPQYTSKEFAHNSGHYPASSLTGYEAERLNSPPAFTLNLPVGRYEILTRKQEAGLGL
jgi:hypothetical protein